MYRVDLNCDMGESFGAYKMGADRDILDFVTSANIDCGYHAGDPATMRKTVKLTMEKGIGLRTLAKCLPIEPISKTGRSLLVESPML